MSWYYSEKILAVEKLNLAWNKQTNFSKFVPLPRVFQFNMLMSRGTGKFIWGDFSVVWLESGKECFSSFKPFLKSKTTFCNYWTLIKIKISMTCVYKEYEGKIKMEQEEWLYLKFLLHYNMKNIFSGRMNLWWGESTGSWKGFFLVREWSE